MNPIQSFKTKTHLFAIFLILILPGVVLGVIWYIYSLDVLQGAAWLMGEFVIWASTLLLIPKLWGSDFRGWLRFDTLKMLKAFEHSTNRTFLGIIDKLPITNQYISREETIDVLSLLRNGKHILVSGESGSGKSGIAASVAKDAVQRGIPVLFLDTRQYSKSVQNLSDLAHEVGLEKPLITCIEKVAKQVGICLLIIDQLDSTLGTPASQASIELLAKASILKKVQVVAVGYISKKPEYKPILELRFIQIHSTAIERTVVKEILRGIGIHSPSEVLLSITENLFYLSIIVQLASSREIDSINNEIRLLEEYLNELEAAEGEEFIQKALDLAYDQLEAGQINFTLPRVKDPATNRLIQRGLIIDIGGHQYRFRHEQLHFFLFAKQAAEKDISLNTMLGNLKTKNVETLIVFVLRYLYVYKHSMMEEFLNMSFNEASGLRFYDRAVLVDEIISWQDIKSHESKLSSFFSLVRKEPYASYFFKQLASTKNSTWFPILKERGFFSPSYEPLETEGQPQNLHWPALQYLTAIAPELPTDIVELAQSLEIENAFGLSALVGSFTKISANLAPSIAPIVVNWLNTGLPIADEIIALINHWKVNQQWEHAFVLIRKILTPQEAPVSTELRQYKYYSPRAQFRDYNYLVEEYLKSIPDFSEAPWLEFVDILEENIIQALKIEQQEGEYERMSYWRPSIEPSSQSFGDHCKDLLLDTGIRIIDKLSPEQRILIIDKYIFHSFSVFRRLAIHLIRTNKHLWANYVVGLYRDEKYWKDIDYYHEYWLFTRDTFSALDEVQQQIYVDGLLAELGEETSNIDEKMRARHWVYRRLWAIKHYLPSKAKDVFEKLREEFGDPNPPEWFAFLAYSSELEADDIVGSKTSKELSEMTLDRVIAELKKDLPSERAGSRGLTKERLSVELENAVKENPSHFSPIAPSLFDNEIHPLYVNLYVHGLIYAWREKRNFEWGPIIELCHMVSKTLDAQTNDGIPLDMKHDYWYNSYGSARKAITELFWAATADDNHAIPHEFLNDVRDILLRLMDDPNPSLEYELDQTRGNSSYIDLSVNVTRAKATATLIQYALHRSRIVQNDETAQKLLPQGQRVEAEVIAKLTSLLDKKLDPSKSVHVNFGIYLPNLNYLNREWLLAHLEEIFPRSLEMVEYWHVAWEGYMWRNGVFASIYHELRPYYLYAIQQLEKAANEKTKNSEKHLATHLALFYAYGDELFDLDDSLITHFFTVASDELRAEFVSSLIPVRIPASLDVKSIEWRRLRSLWQRRYEYIQKQKKIDHHRKELASFLSWIPHIPETLNSFEELIKASVAVADQWQLLNLFEYLAKVVKDYPAFVVNLYETSLHRSDLQYFFMARREHVKTILQAAIYSDIQDAQESAIRVINLFGERGDDSYRDLLKEI